MASSNERLTTAAAHLVKALSTVRMLLLDQDSDLDDNQRAILLNTATYIRKACGTPTDQGLLDLMGMIASEVWFPEAFVDGSYAGHDVYRYDGLQSPRYSAKELVDPDSGISFWHSSEAAVATHLVAVTGAPAGMEYVIR
jgi:hypothetical protein